MSLRQSLLEAIGESCAVAFTRARQHRNFSEDPTLKALLEAAMRRCDQFNDSDQARQEMRDQVLATPPHLRQDLLGHFLATQAQALVAPLIKQQKNNHD